MQGHLVLSTAEVVVEAVLTNLAGVQALILDLKHVLSINESASRLFGEMLLKLHSAGKPVLFTHTARGPQLRRYLKVRLQDQFATLFHACADNDAALEWCEDRLLAAHPTVRPPEPPVAPADYELLAGLHRAEVAVVVARLERRQFRRGEVIVQRGAPAGELFFLVRGGASVTVPLAGGGQKRLATFSPGMAFGEMAMLDRAPRSAVVTADTDVECDLLTLEDFERWGENHPRIQIVLLRNLALSLSGKLRKANREISVFDY